MHTKEFFYNNYTHYPEHVLKRIASEHTKLTPQAQEALRDVLRERGMDELLASLESQEKKKPSLAHLTPTEVRAIINTRLDRGEKIEVIKMDLQDRGVNIFELSLKETEREDMIEERFIQLQKEGKSKIEIDAQLKKEFNLPGKEAAKIPERMYTNGSWFIVIGSVLLMIGVPLFLVMVEDMKQNRNELKLAVAGMGAGLVLLIVGLRKRISAQRFIREAEQAKNN